MTTQNEYRFMAVATGMHKWGHLPLATAAALATLPLDDDYEPGQAYRELVLLRAALLVDTLRSATVEQAWPEVVSALREYRDFAAAFSETYYETRFDATLAALVHDPSRPRVGQEQTAGEHASSLERTRWSVPTWGLILGVLAIGVLAYIVATAVLTNRRPELGAQCSAAVGAVAVDRDGDRIYCEPVVAGNSHYLIYNDRWTRVRHAIVGTP